MYKIYCMPFLWLMTMFALISDKLPDKHRPQLFRIPECEDNCETYSSSDLLLRK